MLKKSFLQGALALGVSSQLSCSPDLGLSSKTTLSYTPLQHRAVQVMKDFEARNARYEDTSFQAFVTALHQTLLPGLHEKTSFTTQLAHVEQLLNGTTRKFSAEKRQEATVEIQFYERVCTEMLHIRNNVMSITKEASCPKETITNEAAVYQEVLAVIKKYQPPETNISPTLNLSLPMKEWKELHDSSGTMPDGIIKFEYSTGAPYTFDLHPHQSREEIKLLPPHWFDATLAHEFFHTHQVPYIESQIKKAKPTAENPGKEVVYYSKDFNFFFSNRTVVEFYASLLTVAFLYERKDYEMLRKVFFSRKEEHYNKKSRHYRPMTALCIWYRQKLSQSFGTEILNTLVVQDNNIEQFIREGLSFGKQMHEISLKAEGTTWETAESQNAGVPDIDIPIL